jgi:hypothetical protein
MARRSAGMLIALCVFSAYLTTCESFFSARSFALVKVAFVLHDEGPRLVEPVGPYFITAKYSGKSPTSVFLYMAWRSRRHVVQS